MNTPAPGIESYIIKGVEDRVTKYFGVAKTVFVSSSDRMSRLQVISQNKDLKFPIAFITMTNGEIDATYNPRSLRRQGVYTDYTDDNTRLGKLYIVPCLMSFNIVLLTDSFENSLRFFKLWMLASTSGSLNFDISYDNIQVQISVGLAPSISIPTREVSMETPNFFEFEGVLNVHGYVSPDFIEQTPVLIVTPTVVVY